MRSHPTPARQQMVTQSLPSSEGHQVWAWRVGVSSTRASARACPRGVTAAGLTRGGALCVVCKPLSVAYHGVLSAVEFAVTFLWPLYTSVVCVPDLPPANGPPGADAGPRWARKGLL